MGADRSAPPSTGSREAAERVARAAAERNTIALLDASERTGPLWVNAGLPARFHRDPLPTSAHELLGTREMLGDGALPRALEHAIQSWPLVCSDGVVDCLSMPAQWRLRHLPFGSRERSYLVDSIGRLAWT